MLLKALICALISVAFASTSETSEGRVRDSVTRHCVPWTAHFLVDGINPRRGEKFIKTLPENVKISFALNKEDLEYRKIRKLARFAIKEGHNIVYRFHPKNDRNFQNTSPAKLVEQLAVIKQYFTEKFNYNLQYVFFPRVNHHLKKHTRAVEAAGFTVFGNCAYAHRKLYKEVRAMAKDNSGAIIYFNGLDDRLMDKMESVASMTGKAKMQLTDITRCLAWDAQL